MTGRLKVYDADTGTWKYVDIAVLPVPAGTVFPLGPAVNDRFFRTDLRLEFFWSGTYWLTTTLFTASYSGYGSGFNTALAATTGSVWRGTVPELQGCSDFFIVNASLSFNVSAGGTALSASHAWTVGLYYYEPGSTIAVLTINSGASNVFRRVDTPVNATVGMAGASMLQANLSKVGTPGSFAGFFPVFTYRLVAV